MKKLAIAAALALIAICPTVFGQEITLTSVQKQPGTNFQLGAASQPLNLVGLNVRDQSSNLLYSIPLLSNPSSVGANTQITDTVYAVTPPDSNKVVIVIVMYRVELSQTVVSDEIVHAVNNTLTQNGWFGAQVQIRTANPEETVPAGTQFWICSSTGYVTFADNGTISLAIEQSDPAQPDGSDQKSTPSQTTAAPL
jgi:hypothetical protein